MSDPAIFQAKRKARRERLRDRVWIGLGFLGAVGLSRCVPPPWERCCLCLAALFLVAWVALDLVNARALWEIERLEK